MEIPERYKRERESCVYVGKGPSASFAKDFLSFGDIATVNDATLLFDHVDWSFWVDIVRDEIIQDAVGRGATIVLPDKMHNSSLFNIAIGRTELVETKTLSFYNPENTILYPYERVDFRESDLIRAMDQDKVPACSTASGGLYMLAVHLKYKHIRCFGFDGGFGYAKGVKYKNPLGNYTIFRKAMETIASYIHKRYGTVIEFIAEDGSFSG